MTQVVIDDVIPRTQLVASAGQTVFNTNWTADAATDINVYRRADGEVADDITQIVSPSLYNVTFVGGSQTVRVTFLSGVVLNDVITIVRNTPAERQNLYINTNFVPSMLNQDFGILTLVDQQAQMYDTVINPGYNVSATIDYSDKILPILGAQQIWRKNETNTAFEAYTIDSTPAPSNSYFLTYGEDVSLENEQNLALLGDGLLKQTVAGGFATIEIAIPGVDYLSPAMPLGTMAYQDANNVNITGGVAALTGGSVLNSPVNAIDLVNKAYADSIAAGFIFKASCVAATTVNLSATYSNGASGVGATLTRIGNGAISVDGVSPVLNDRILVKNQSTTFQNGIYTVTTVGSAGAPYVLTRAVDFDTPAEIQPGSIIFIQDGSTQADTSFVETELVAVVGTSPILFTQFSQQYPLSLGNGGTGVSLVAVNNAVMSTTAGGVVQLSTTLPAGLTIPGYATSGANSNITSMTGLTGYLQYPVGIKDTTGAIVATFTTNGVTPVNYIDLVNNPSGTAPGVRALGGDTNIDMATVSKGTGQNQAWSANITTPIAWKTGTTFQHTTNFAVANTAASRTVTLQDADGTLAFLTDRNMVLLGSGTANNTSQFMTFTNIPTTYRNLLMIWSNVTPATNGSILGIQGSLNNGSSFLNSSGDYNLQAVLASATSLSTSNNTTNIYFATSNASTNTGGGTFGCSGFCYLTNFTVAGRTGMLSNAWYVTTSLVSANYQAYGQITSASVLNAVAFVSTSGNLVTGTFQLYGLS